MNFQLKFRLTGLPVMRKVLGLQPYMRSTADRRLKIVSSDQEAKECHDDK